MSYVKTVAIEKGMLLSVPGVTVYSSIAGLCQGTETLRYRGIAAIPNRIGAMKKLYAVVISSVRLRNPSSITKAHSTTVPPSLVTSAAVAAAVPPVAINHQR